MAKTKKVQIIRRNADDGRFVTKKFVESHPKTTVTERRKVK